METIITAIDLYQIMIIHNLFISLLVVKLFSYLFNKDVYNTSKQILRWLIISYGAMGILYLAYNIITINGWSKRATGPYAFASWLIVLLSCLLPFLLLLKKFRNSDRAIFVVAFFINTGWLFERYVIIVTSLHRDYLPSSWSMDSPFTPLVTSLIRGVIIGFFITAISVIVTKYRKTQANDIKAL